MADPQLPDPAPPRGRRALAPSLPAALTAVLGTDDLDGAVGFTVQLISQRPDGWLHVAMLSVGELWVRAPDRLLVALWPESTTSANLTANGRATLAVVAEETSFVIHANARRRADLRTQANDSLACFELTVVNASADRAPYAVLESGVRFRLPAREAVLPRWREVRAALAQLGDQD